MNPNDDTVLRAAEGTLYGYRADSMDELEELELYESPINPAEAARDGSDTTGGTPTMMPPMMGAPGSGAAQGAGVSSMARSAGGAAASTMGPIGGVGSVGGARAVSTPAIPRNAPGGIGVGTSAAGANLPGGVDTDGDGIADDFPATTSYSTPGSRIYPGQGVTFDALPHPRSISDASQPHLPGTRTPTPHDGRFDNRTKHFDVTRPEPAKSQNKITPRPPMGKKTRLSAQPTPPVISPRHELSDITPSPTPSVPHPSAFGKLSPTGVGTGSLAAGGGTVTVDTDDTMQTAKVWQELSQQLTSLGTSIHSLSGQFGFVTVPETNYSSTRELGSKLATNGARAFDEICTKLTETTSGYRATEDTNQALVKGIDIRIQNSAEEPELPAPNPWNGPQWLMRAPADS